MPDAAMPKVCFVAPVPPPYGGIANWTMLVTKELSRRGVEFDLIDTSPRRRAVDGRSMFERLVVGGLGIFKLRAELERSIHNGSRVVHITTSSQFAVVRDIVLLRLCRRLGVGTAYHLKFGRVPEMREQNTLEWKWLRHAMSLASLTMAIDRATYEALIPVLGPERVACVPNPVGVSSLPQANGDSGRRVMYLGWVIRDKGIEELLQAWAVFHVGHADWCLDIVGPINPAYHAELKSRYCLDGVSVCGEKEHDEAMEMLAESSVFVLPSYTEGFPNVILEAMGLGRAIIGTRVGAMPEMLADGCGLLIEPRNPEAVLRALQELADDPSTRVLLGGRARAKVLQEYSLEVVLPQYARHWAGLA
jgi:glycosyltransferase involved in cell wall biosynthesis